MKKVIAFMTAFIMAGLVGLAGCSSNNEAAGDVSEEDTDIRTDILEEASEEKLTEHPVNEAAEDSEEVSENPEKKQSVSTDISSEDRVLLQKVYEGGLLVMHTDGSFGVLTEDEAEDRKMMSYYGMMLSDEYYEMLKEYDMYSSKEEYVAEIFEMYPQLEKYYDGEGNLLSSSESEVFIEINGSSDNEAEELSEEAFYRTGEWVLSKLRGSEELRSKLTDEAKKIGMTYAFAEYELDSKGVIGVVFYGSGYDDDRIFSEDKFHVSGKEGVLIGDSFIFADTKKLALTSRGEMIFHMLAGSFVPEDCELICAGDDNYSEELLVDLAEVADKLPDLTELYMYQANVTNIQALSDMENLEVLSYYPEGDSSTPFVKLKNLKALRLYGNYSDYSFLNEMDWPEEIHVTYNGDDRNVLDSLFECTGITSLEIYARGSDFKLDINGIDKLSRLKKLDITGSDIDFAPISRLPELEDLHVRCVSGEKNVKEPKNAPKLKKLFLSDLDIMNWNFLEDMPVLEDLNLSYIPNITNADIAPLKNLKSLGLCEAGCDSRSVEGLENLERFSYSIYSGWQDYSKLSTCTSLRELAVMGSGGVLDCEDIKNAPLEIIYCDGTDVKNVEALAEVKTLKSIYIAMEEGNPDCGDMLREALPDCNVNFEGQVFFHTAG